MLDDIKNTLWAAADELRANMDAAEYKHIVLGLILLKYISNTFTARRDQLARRFADESDDYFLPDADAAMLAEELEDRNHYKEANVYDPCCGSGGMFVQSEKFVESDGGKLGDISIYGQESNATTRRLAIMNLTIRGFEADIGKEHADTFRNVCPSLFRSSTPFPKAHLTL